MFYNYREWFPCFFGNYRKYTKSRKTFEDHTGSLAMMKRTIIKQEIEKHNARLSSSISNNTDFLILGDNPGSKFEKAKQLNIKIINEEDFLTMLESS